MASATKHDICILLKHDILILPLHARLLLIYIMSNTKTT
jgi:hypothetical protein